MRSASLEMSSGRRAVSSTPTAAGPRRRRERGRQGGREGGPKTMGERERERERPAVYSRTKLFLRSSFSLECASNPRDLPVWTRNSLMVTFGKKASFQLPLSCFTAEFRGYSAKRCAKV